MLSGMCYHGEITYIMEGIRRKCLRDQAKVTYAIALKGGRGWYSDGSVLRTGEIGH